jgi:hypothetical protein
LAFSRRISLPRSPLPTAGFSFLKRTCTKERPAAPVPEDLEAEPFLDSGHGSPPRLGRRAEGHTAASSRIPPHRFSAEGNDPHQASGSGFTLDHADGR